MLSEDFKSGKLNNESSVTSHGDEDSREQRYLVSTELIKGIHSKKNSRNNGRPSNTQDNILNI